MELNNLGCIFGGVLTGCNLHEVGAELIAKGAKTPSAAAIFTEDVRARDLLATLCKVSPSICMIPRVLQELVSPAVPQK